MLDFDIDVDKDEIVSMSMSKSIDLDFDNLSHTPTGRRISMILKVRESHGSKKKRSQTYTIPKPSRNQAASEID